MQNKEPRGEVNVKQAWQISQENRMREIRFDMCCGKVGLLLWGFSSAGRNCTGCVVLALDLCSVVSAVTNLRSALD